MATTLTTATVNASAAGPRKRPAVHQPATGDSALASCHALGEPVHGLTALQPIGIYSIPEIS
jgi:hypothetical protein